MNPRSGEESMNQISDEESMSQTSGEEGRCSSNACYRKSLPIAYALSLLTLIILVEIAGGYLFGRFLTNAGELEVLWATAFLRLVDFMLILFFVHLSGQGMSAIGLAPGEGRNGIFKGLLWSFGFGLIVFATWGLFLLFHVNLFQYLISSPTDYFWWTILIGGIFAPIVEDSFFVGGLYNALRRKFNILWSVLGVSLFFALLHIRILLMREIPITQIIGGILFTLSFEYSDNLLTPISIHILANCTLFAIAYSPWVQHILHV
jgi:membrane protease YdiL (CAAX protease family)